MVFASSNEAVCVCVLSFNTVVHQVYDNEEQAVSSFPKRVKRIFVMFEFSVTPAYLCQKKVKLVRGLLHHSSPWMLALLALYLSLLQTFFSVCFFFFFLNLHVSNIFQSLVKTCSK